MKIRRGQTLMVELRYLESWFAMKGDDAVVILGGRDLRSSEVVTTYKLNKIL
jgi:hypothetical protein